MVNEKVVVPEKVKKRLIAKVPEFQKTFLKLRKDAAPEKAVESEVVDILQAVFGFRKFEEIHFQVKAGVEKGGVMLVDLAIVLAGEIRYAVEVKAAHVELTAAFVKKTEDWANAAGVASFVLTNGIEWQIRVINKKESSKSSLVSEFDLTKINPRKEDDRKKLYMLCKKGVEKNLINKAAQYKNVMNAYVIGAVLQHSSLLHEVRRKIKKLSPGFSVNIDEIQNIVEEEVLRGYTMEGEYAEDAKKKVRRALGK